MQEGSIALIVTSEEKKREAKAGILGVNQEWRDRFVVEMEG